MKVLPLVATLAVLSGCIVVDRRPAYRAPPPPDAAPAPAPGLLTEAQAIEIAFRVARERGLAVDRVHHAHLDGAGRWHVDLRGRGDKAKVLLDARDGRLLRADLKD